VVSAAIVIGGIGTVAGLVRALRAEDLAREEALRAQREATVAERVTAYMETVFEAADPDRARGREITAKDLLDEGKSLLERPDLKSDADIRARFMETIGRSYRTIGAYGDALPLLREALELRRAEGEDADLFGALNLVATVLVSMECYEQAAAYLDQAVTLAERVHGPEHTDTAAALKNLADAKSRSGQHDEARPLYERALRIRENVHGPDHVYVAISLAGLAEALSRAGQHDEAIELLGQSLDIRLRRDPEDRSAGWGHYSMAEGLLAAGRTRPARDHYEATLAIWEPLLGREPEHIARVLTGLAQVELELGNAARAEALLRRALAIEEQSFGPEHPFVAETLLNLAAALEEQGRMNEAESLESRAAAIDTPVEATCE
jgi:tetratricopeptide (TPR) repeat protein